MTRPACSLMLGSILIQASFVFECVCLHDKSLIKASHLPLHGLYRNNGRLLFLWVFNARGQSYKGTAMGDYVLGFHPLILRIPDWMVFYIASLFLSILSSISSSIYLSRSYTNSSKIHYFLSIVN